LKGQETYGKKGTERKGFGSEVRTAWLILENVSWQQVTVIDLNQYTIQPVVLITEVKSFIVLAPNGLDLNR